MGGRKFHLGRPIKNAEIKKRNASTLVVSIPRSILQIHVCPQLSLSFCSEEQPGKPADDQHLTVSLPRSAFVNSHVTSLQQLTSRVSMLTVSLPWVITSYLPLILCRIEVSGDHQPILEVSFTIDAHCNGLPQYCITFFIPLPVSHCLACHIPSRLQRMFIVC